jgi:hypothetical protein
VDEVDPDFAVRLDGEIAFGAAFDVGPVVDIPDWGGIAALRSHWLIFDADGRDAALVPETVGTAWTSKARWELTVERRRFGWRLAAYFHENARPVATASPAVRPNSYRLDLNPESNRAISLRLISKRNWILRLHGQQVADISRRRGGGRWDYTVELTSRPPRQLPADLVTVFAVHCVLVDRAMPNIGAGFSG